MHGMRVGLVLAAVACGGGKDGDGGADVGDSSASFDVTGTWIGTAVDDNSAFDVTLELDNNGGEYGMDLAGTLALSGLGSFPFTSSYIDSMPGPSRVSAIEAVDEQGYTYKLQGSFTELRMDGGQLLSSNPEAGVDLVFLETVLVKQ